MFWLVEDLPDPLPIGQVRKIPSEENLPLLVFQVLVLLRLLIMTLCEVIILRNSHCEY